MSDETERENLAEAITAEINKFLTTGFALARGSFGLPPCQVELEWVGEHALDQAQYLHLSGVDCSLTPKIMQLIAEADR